METLTIQHISPYTISKLKFKIDKRSQEEFEMIEVGQNYVTLHHEEYGTKRYFLSTNIYSPILYPISCLTKEIQYNGETFVPLIELAKIEGFYNYVNGYSSITQIGKNEVIGISDGVTSFCYSEKYSSFILRHEEGAFVVRNQYQLFQKLAEWHINFNGIPEGLYIDKQTLKLTNGTE